MFIANICQCAVRPCNNPEARSTPVLVPRLGDVRHPIHARSLWGSSPQNLPALLPQDTQQKNAVAWLGLKKKKQRYTFAKALEVLWHFFYFLEWIYTTCMCVCFVRDMPNLLVLAPLPRDSVSSPGSRSLESAGGVRLFHTVSRRGMALCFPSKPWIF